MRKPALLLLSALLGFANLCFSQDVITKRNGDKLTTKVLRVNLSDIEYKMYDNIDGPLHTLLKADVASIAYPNGSKDSFPEALNAHYNEQSLADQGTEDAKAYYKGYKKAELWGGISALYPFYGLISTAIIASSRPRYETLNFPDRTLMDNYDYRQAYETKAYKMKKGKTWEGFGIGTGVLVTIVAAVLIGTMQH